MLRKLRRFFIGNPSNKLTAASKYIAHERKMMRREAKIGGTVLGTVPEGHTREFFCLDRYTWVWYEEWFDDVARQRRSMTVQYEVQHRGVLKQVDGNPQGYLHGAELENLLRAMQLYYKRIATEVYGRQLATA